MSRSTFRIPIVLMASAVLGACGESTGVDSTLTEEEAVALAAAIVQAAFVASADLGSGPAQAGGPQAAPYAFNEDLSFTAECPLGGGVAVDGSVDVEGDDETGEGRIELSVTHEHGGCVVEADNGMMFTLDGSPRVELDLVLESNGEGQLDWTGSIEGGVDWATEEREGRCSIDLAFSGALSVGSSIAVDVAGSVCQRAIEHSWSLVVGTG